MELNDPYVFPIMNPLESSGTNCRNSFGVCFLDISDNLGRKFFWAPLPKHEAITFTARSFDNGLPVAVRNRCS